MTILADVQITVLDNASPIIKQMAASLHDFSPALETMGLILDRSIKRQFQASGKPKWKPLAPITVFYRRNHSDKPLLDTGRLMRSYVTRTTDGIYNLSSHQLVIGSNLSYAAVHQFGGESNMQEKRWFRKGRKGKSDTQVDAPEYTKSGRVSTRYKLKNINSTITIKVPARPLSIQREDVLNMKTALERWIMKQARK